MPPETKPNGGRPDVRVTGEPDIYRRGGPHSYLRDLAAASGIAVYRVSPAEAGERLERHSRFEERRLHDRPESRSAARYGINTVRGDGAQTRALSTATGAGGEFVPPKYLTEIFASVSRAACPLRGLVTSLDLPEGTLELRVPRFDVAGGVVPQSVQNTTTGDALSQTDQIISEVATFAGSTILSQQEFDRGGDLSDEIIAHDFAENHGANLAQQMTSGSGSNGQLLGLINVSTSTVNSVPGARLATYTSAGPTPAAMTQAIAQCAAEISDTRERAPSLAVMRGARYFWMVGSPDGSTNEPAQRPGTGVLPDDTDLGPYGPIAGLPVYHDNTLPTNLGSGTNQDVIVLVRAKDIILLEEPAGARYTIYTGTTAAGELAVVINYHAYVGWLPQRYPSAVGTVSGTGLVVPSGF